MKATVDALMKEDLKNRRKSDDDDDEDGDVLPPVKKIRNDFDEDTSDT